MILLTSNDINRFDSFEELKANMENYMAKIQQTGWLRSSNIPIFYSRDNHKPDLKLGLGTGGITLYTPFGDTHLMLIRTFPIFPREIDEVAELVEKGRLRCNECGSWKLAKNMLHYSFAGIVCKKCYNPKHHKAPNTKGD